MLFYKRYTYKRTALTQRKSEQDVASSLQYSQKLKVQHYVANLLESDNVIIGDLVIHFYQFKGRKEIKDAKEQKIECSLFIPLQCQLISGKEVLKYRIKSILKDCEQEPVQA